jgi:hypothetical protein
MDEIPSIISHVADGDGEPGSREEYGAEYYGGFVRDPEGHKKIETAFWDESKSEG